MPKRPVSPWRTSPVTENNWMRLKSSLSFRFSTQSVRSMASCHRCRDWTALRRLRCEPKSKSLRITLRSKRRSPPKSFNSSTGERTTSRTSLIREISSVSLKSPNFWMKGRRSLRRRMRPTSKSTSCARSVPKRRRPGCFSNRRMTMLRLKKLKKKRRSKIELLPPNISKRSGTGSRPKVNSSPRRERRVKARVERKRRSESVCPTLDLNFLIRL